ncbi:MAG TPA: iron-containing alcohol dehydrogenase [Saccharofermentans sp.]|jgi:alcohol dehydrogenase YqhD (iron-dependent ADH family)|nr:iron-containing alcohol dehydrogenase [Clostridia bacterium]NLX68302.1 iron-containing alcohol dehydrogenase [Clostridiaceae bacterium]HPE27275.1 iron-containing alcohol dehydrogenase [Saccharofermentans sp.]HPG63890.1 iron-containing alcohol dehydrogenase [Saccharofermentans sp.]HRV50738.1 iron-containing alcohol dehydrogenase [Saccharofermentans sp.]
MDNFDFFSPTEFVFGKGRENEVGKYVRKHGGTKVLIHYGSGSAVKSGLVDRVKASLKSEGIDFIELGGVKPNPRDTLVYTGIDECRSNGVDFILAVGGGSCIDSAKGIACGVPYEGDFWDFYSGKAVVSKALPIGTILTIAAAGSEGSGASVVTQESTMLKRDTGSDLLRPVFSILNPELTCTLPAFQTGCGATDIMAHIFERYFTNTREVEVTDRLCEALLLTMIKETPRVIADPYNYEARANIMWAGTVAHNDIVGVGRSQDWNSHGIEHELSGLYDVAHGAGLAVVMPSWMEFVMSHDVMRFARMATRVFGCQMNFDHPEVTAKEGIYAFRSFLKSIGMPINFESLGAKASDIPTLVHNLGLNGGKTGGFVSLSEEDVASILQIAVDAK